MPYTSYPLDVFVSYGHLDNLSADEQGWIDRFHRDLGWRVSQLLGETVEIWRDNSLGGNVDFEREIVEKVRHAAVLVPVLSPRYMKSDWCQRELEAFLDGAEKVGGLAIGNHPRLFKVIKTPVDLMKQNGILQRSLGFPFYREDESGTPREWPSRDDDGERKYTRKIDELADAIRKLLEAMKTPEKETTPRKCIYLAETSGDMTEYRDELKRELVARGFSVLPDHALPLESEQLQKEVKMNLAESSLSLHLVGSRYGVVPEGDDVTESAVWTQARLSSERQKDGAFRCLIWHPPNLELKDSRQVRFIEALQVDLQKQKFMEFLRVPFEGFKTHVVDRLQPPPPPPPPVMRENRWIYLVCDSRDYDSARAIQNELEDLGHQVDLPAREGDVSALRADHEETLRDCDAVLIYYGTGSEAWLREKVRDLRKAPVLGRQRKFLAQGVLVGPPDSEIKRDYHNPALCVEQWAGGAGAVAPKFLQELSVAVQ